MGVSGLMKQAVRRLQRREGGRKPTSLPEPKRAPGLRLCKYWKRAVKRCKAESRRINQMSVQKTRAVGSLSHFYILRLETRASPQKKGMYHMRKGKVSLVHLGTNEPTLFWPLKACSLTSGFLPHHCSFFLNWSLPMTSPPVCTELLGNATK